MNKVVILRGISGSGKSTYVDQFYPQSEVCSADHFFITKDGIYDFNSMMLPRAHNACMNHFLNSLKNNIPLIVVDNTNIHLWEYEQYEKVARLAGYEVDIVELRVGTIDGLKKCAARNSHRVPRDIVAKMAIEFEPDCRAKVVDVIVK